MRPQANDDPPSSASLELEVEELREQTQRLHRELIQRSYEMGELERKAHAREEELLTSLSWRLTAPLRAVMVVVRKLLRR